MARDEDRKATKAQRAVGEIIAGAHGNPPEPFEWLLSRFYMLSKGVGVSSQSEKAQQAMALAQWLTPYMEPRKRAVDVHLKADHTVVFEIGGGEDEDFSADYDDAQFDDLIAET